MSVWVPHFIKYYWDSKVRGIRKPILGGFKITHNCNMRCAHCPYWRRTYDDLDFGGVKAVLRKMHDIGVRILIIEGGEPFVWKDRGENKSLRDVVEYARPFFFSVGVTTNGSFPIMDFPADVVWVSFDGMKKTYTRIRGDNFERLMLNIKQTDHKNLLVNITINRWNEKELEEMVQFISPYVKGITIQFHYPYGIENDDNMFIPLQQRESIINRLKGLKKEGYPLIDSYACFDDLKDNSWVCHDWMLANANPDGSMFIGCYLKNRGDIDCRSCGFAAHVEISKGFDLHLPAINVGRKVFRYRRINS